MHRELQTYSINLGSAGDCSLYHHTYTVSDNSLNSYTLDDPIGVELAGALKNVYAIAAGIAEGLGFENNTRASKYHQSRHGVFY